MALDESAIARACARIRDAYAGQTFDERLRELHGSLNALVGPVEVTVFTYDREAMRPDAPRRFERLASETGLVWSSRSEALWLLREYSEHWIGADAVPRVAATRTHEAHLFTFDSRGRTAIEADFYPRIDVRQTVVAGLGVTAREGLALSVYRGAREPEYREAERRAIEAVYDDVLVLSRGLLLRERIERERAAGGAGGVGVAVLDPHGELVDADVGARRLLGAVALPATALADLLSAVGQTLCPTPGRRPADPPRTLERSLPLEGGRHALASFTALADPPRVVLTIRAIPAGVEEHFRAEADRAGLTAREREVARPALEGLSNREIAHELGLAVETVKRHLASVYRKLGATGRTALHDLLGTDDRGG